MAEPAKGEVDIANKCLVKLGQSRIRSLEDPKSEIARIMRDTYPDARQYALCLSAWTFATKQAVLSKVVEAPLFGPYTAMFQIPPDYLALKDIISDPTINLASRNYRILQDKIHFSTDANSINIEYIYDERDVSKWSPAFKDVVACHMAVQTGWAITKKKGVVEAMEVAYRSALWDAISKDGQDEPPVIEERSKALEMRTGYGYGLSDDPTRVIFE